MLHFDEENHQCRTEEEASHQENLNGDHQTLTALKCWGHKVEEEAEELKSSRGQVLKKEH